MFMHVNFVRNLASYYCPVTGLMFLTYVALVTGIFLLRKFHLRKFHLENSSYGKFLLWKKTM